MDICGIGLESGKLIIHNLRTDETLMSFHQDWGPVTAVSFRTGMLKILSIDIAVYTMPGFHFILVLTDGVATVATASSAGHIVVWGLDERRIVTVVRDAHDGAVGGMEFIQSQPLMVTSGSDNSIKVSLLMIGDPLSKNSHNLYNFQFFLFPKHYLQCLRSGHLKFQLNQASIFEVIALDSRVSKKINLCSIYK